MIFKNRKIKFLGLLLSVTIILSLVGSAFYVFAEPSVTQAEEPETTVAEYEEETSPDTSAVDTQPVDTPIINIPIEDVDVSDISGMHF